MEHKDFFKPKSEKEAAEFVDKHAGEIKIPFWQRVREWWYKMIRKN